MTDFPAWQRVSLRVEDLPETVRWIAEKYGIEVVLDLVHRYGGTYMQIPKCEGAFRAARDRRIRELYDAGGRSMAVLARQFGLTDRQILNILNQSPEGSESPQGSLL